MSMQTLAQQRAKHAWGVVETQWKARQGFGDFADQAKKLPVRIMTSGLGQSLAFVRAKDKAPDLLKALKDWMAIYQPGTGELLERVIQGNSDFQRLATAECLVYLEWLVRFADAHKKE
jgi:CRISPR/Cas system CMR-associated protein Cmr5 small subunit